jgi:hypothetical protein
LDRETSRTIQEAAQDPFGGPLSLEGIQHSVCAVCGGGCDGFDEEVRPPELGLCFAAGERALEPLLESGLAASYPLRPGVAGSAPPFLVMHFLGRIALMVSGKGRGYL